MTKDSQQKPFQLTNPVHFLALGFGSGLLKPAPGTWGTLAAVPLYLLLSLSQPIVYIAVTVLVCIAGIWICGRCAADIGAHDHGSIVWDEIAGFLVTMAFVEVTLVNVLLGFGLFRLFDIVKPWPIGMIDRKVHGGLGIMLDDIVAGLLALFVMQLIIKVI